MSTILRLVDSFSGRKFVAIALTAITLGIGTKVYASGNPLPVPVERQAESPTISLSVKNVSLEELLRLLKEKSGYYFLYNSNAVRKIKGITMNARHARVESILDKCLAATPFEYVIKDGTTIVIKARKGQEAFVEAADKEEQRKHVIEGVVTSKATKKPLAGVTVYIKGSRHGNITDSEGRYRLVFDSVSPKASIIFSFVGMESQEFAYTGQTRINVAMAEALAEVENVVVTGYANIRKESFTGNTVSIGRDELQKVSKTNVMKAIQTFDPSFRIRENNNWGSDPNALPEVYIRGESGIGTKELDQDQYSKANLKDNPNLPVFILDGFQISAQKLYDMDPNRIENITILKDAAATALYGSRAANGVVVITSVAPKPGKFNISYSMVGDVVTPDLSDYDLLNAAEKLELEVLAGCYDPEKTGLNAIDLRKEYNAKLANIKKGVDTYWLGKPLRTAFNHKHSIYIDGGSDALRFGVDFQYANQDGVMKGSKRDRIGAGFYLQYVYKNISIKNYASFLQTDSHESPYGSFSDYTEALPYDEFKDENGNYLEELRTWDPGSGSNRQNPLYEAGLGSYDKTRNQEFINNLSVNWNITNYLLFKAQLSLTKVIAASDRFLDPQSKKNAEILSVGNLSSGSLFTNRSEGMNYDMSAYFSYNRSFENHNLNVQAGVNILDDSSSDLNASYLGFPSGSLSSVNYAQRLDGKPVSSESTTRTVGFLAAVNYSFRNIYLVDASCRFDGNSAFGKDKRFAPFWSGGLGLNIHNYGFMKDSFIDLLRIRASYGQTGKINFPAYAARTTYNILTDEWYKTGYGASLIALGNPNLKWETTNTFDAGFELGMWDSRFYTKFSFYNRLTVDLINDVTIPSSTGFTTYRDNVGEIRNRGVEVDLRVTAVRTRDLFLTFNANLAHNTNKLMKVAESLKEYNKRVQDMIDEGANRNDENMSRPFTQYVEGVSINSIWGMKSLGINPASGEEVFVTKDGRIIDTWTTSQQQVLGIKDPKIQGSFGFNLMWKQFSLYASFLYEAGGQRYNQTLADKVEGVSIYQSNVDRRVLQDRWSTPGQKALYKKMEHGRNGFESTRPTSRFVQNYNMLQLNSLTLGYDFKKSTIAPLRLSMLRFELSANDLFHVASVKQERGLNYPYARTFSFSIQAAF